MRKESQKPHLKENPDKERKSQELSDASDTSRQEKPQATVASLLRFSW